MSRIVIYFYSSKFLRKIQNIIITKIKSKNGVLLKDDIKTNETKAPVQINSIDTSKSTLLVVISDEVY